MIVKIVMGFFIIISILLFGVWFIRASITGDFSHYPGGQNRYFDYLDY